MDLIELKTFALEQMNRYPQSKGEIADLFHLAASEVDDGESEEHECELAFEAIKSIKVR